ARGRSAPRAPRNGQCQRRRAQALPARRIQGNSGVSALQAGSFVDIHGTRAQVGFAAHLMTRTGVSLGVGTWPAEASAQRPGGAHELLEGVSLSTTTRKNVSKK